MSTSSSSTKLISKSSCVNSGWRSALRSSSLKQRAILEVALESGDHQQLLQLLRRLGQGVEAARLEAARNEKVPCPFRSALDENRRLNLQELPFVQEISDVFHDFCV